MENKFYIYVYLDPRIVGEFIYGDYKFDYQPFYVGKGVGDRCYDTNRNDSYAKKKQQINRNNQKIIIVKYKIDLDESEALSLESKFIDIFGLTAYNTYSWLLNLDEGYNKEERRKMYQKGSGHALLKILSGFALVAFSMLFFWKILIISPIFIIVIITALEMLIAFLQTYVLVTLVLIYTGEQE